MAEGKHILPQYVTFYLDDSWYSFPIGTVKKILPPFQVTPVPTPGEIRRRN